MKVIVAGSRSIYEAYRVEAAIEASPWLKAGRNDELVSGGARGVDYLGERWARERGILVKQFLADWDKYGKRAGFIRNKEMAEYADALIAVWDGESCGTENMIDISLSTGLHVFVVQL